VAPPPAPTEELAKDLLDWFASLRIANLTLDTVRPVFTDLGVSDLDSLTYVYQEGLISRDSLGKAGIKAAPAGLFLSAIARVR
jgi:hypothetical protein